VKPRDGHVLETTPDAYHALPGFSPSIAKVLISRSPMHASQAMIDEKAPTLVMDRGNVMHRLILGAGKSFRPIAFNDWRKAEAKAEREKARKEGFVPVLASVLDEYQAAVRQIGARIAQLGVVLDGVSELAVTWTEDDGRRPLVCRTMMDHVRIGPLGAQIFELKIVDDASESAVERSAENMGYALASAANVRSITALHPHLAGRIEFFFIFAEPDPPYAVNVCERDSLFRELGERRWIRAVQTWAECEAKREWPAHHRGGHINTISVPPWALAREGYTAEERGR
jgi:hypothetical protein